MPPDLDGAAEQLKAQREEEKKQNEWQLVIGSFGSFAEVDPPKSIADLPRFMNEVFGAREEVYSLGIKKLRAQVQFEQDTKTLIQKGSTAELMEHREFKATVRVLLFAILHSLEDKQGEAIWRMVPKIKEFLGE